MEPSGDRPSAEEMDEKRKKQIAYEYLCALHEAKCWIEVHTGETLPKTTEFEELLRNGVILAKVAAAFCPKIVSLEKIYDRNLTRYYHDGLHFRHTDNINLFIKALKELQLPQLFWPETTDIYDKKNMPKLVYCIHALSHHLFKLGQASLMEDFYGKVEFSNDELESVCVEISMNNIQIPAFNKIGGLLATQLLGNNEDIDAAIIEINNKIDKLLHENTLKALQNRSACLTNVLSENSKLYQENLYAAKTDKHETTLNKSLDPNLSLTLDIYDEILTQGEIQGIINVVNMSEIVRQLILATEHQDMQQIMTILSSGSLKLHNIHDTNKDWYFIVLEKTLSKLKTKIQSVHNPRKINEFLLIKEDLQNVIDHANDFANKERLMNEAISYLHLCLEGSDPNETFKILTHPDIMLPQGLRRPAAPLIHQVLKDLKHASSEPLRHEELTSAIESLKCVISINEALDSNSDEDSFLGLLLDTKCPFQHIIPSNALKYQEEMNKIKEKKRTSSITYLSKSEIQKAIVDANKLSLQENARIEAVIALNNAISRGDHKMTFDKLVSLSSCFTRLSPESSELYQIMLGDEREKKMKIRSEEDLWIDEIREIICRANIITTKAHVLGSRLSSCNMAIDKQDAIEIFHYLTNKDLGIKGVIRDCKSLYLQRLIDVRRFKVHEQGKSNTGWLSTRHLDYPVTFYFNIKDRRLFWSKPSDEDFAKDPSVLNREELQAVVDAVNSDYHREMMYLANEPLIIRLQALIKGYLVRQNLNTRREFYRQHIEEIVIIQTWWRSIIQRRRYLTRLQYFRRNVQAIIKMQACVRMYLDRRKYLNRLEFFKLNEHYVVKIQSFWRSCRARHDYRSLLASEHPSLTVIKKFLPLLENSDIDYQEEIELQALKQQISNAIRNNRALELDLRHMDLIIGLLVRNRISIDEVMRQNVKLKTYREKLNTQTDEESADGGLRALNKASQNKLLAYSHLFYLLQTNPSYLANLIYKMPQSVQTRFVETVIFSLYNYGSNARDEYLLLKLFKTAVELEIMTKITDHPADFLSANPFVIRLIIGLCRTAHAQTSLKSILQPLIETFLDEVKTTLSANPVEVYKNWVNKMEMESGAACGLPYEVTAQAALEHETVREMIADSVTQLRSSCQKFLQTLIRAPDRLPYSLRYMAKVIKITLRKRFPSVQEKEILKVVGNLIYYRYVNSAIVAPDAFDILDHKVIGNYSSTASGQIVLSPEKRRNLASVAKILQFATANKGFGPDSPHLAHSLNPFIRECHDQFKNYFLQVCDVPEPEQYFSIDQYSDYTSLTKPTIRMTFKEILDTHALLVQYEDEIAPGHTDPLHEILEDLGDLPKSAKILLHRLDFDARSGDGPKQSNSSDDFQGKLFDNRDESQEICLLLEPKHDAQTGALLHLDAGNAATESLFIRTKRLIIDVLACMDQQGFSGAVNQPVDLLSFLERTCTLSEIDRHDYLLRSRSRLDQYSTPSKSSSAQHIVRAKSVLSETRLSLEEKKQRILSNLNKLESAGLLSRSDGFESLSTAIVKDIRHLRSYRSRRKQEMLRLRGILDQLLEKRKFHQEQIDYYSRYCNSCIENMAYNPRKTKRTKQLHELDSTNNNQSSGDTKTRTSYRFTAAELHKKGVILEIQGLSSSEFKKLQFEIARDSNGPPGTFEATAYFLGVAMDRVQLILSELLEMQYEGFAVITLFNRAKVNLNLLLFLLNKKFFFKKQ